MDPEQAQEAVRQSQNIALSNDMWQALATAFTLGGFSSLVWTIRQGKSPTKSQILGTALSSGMMAIAFGAWVLDSNLGYLKLIIVSILCGFSGDAIIRLVVGLFHAAVKKAGNRLLKWIGWGSKDDNDDKPTKDDE